MFHFKLKLLFQSLFMWNSRISYFILLFQICLRLVLKIENWDSFSKRRFNLFSQNPIYREKIHLDGHVDVVYCSRDQPCPTVHIECHPYVHTYNIQLRATTCTASHSCPSTRCVSDCCSLAIFLWGKWCVRVYRYPSKFSRRNRVTEQQAVVQRRSKTDQNIFWELMKLSIYRISFLDWFSMKLNNCA